MSNHTEWVVRQFPTGSGGRDQDWVMDSIPDDNGKVIANVIVTPQSCEDWPSRARVISAAMDMLDVLESVEWNGLGEFRSCPSCFGWKPNGHKPNCKLAAAIRKAKGGAG